MGKYRKKPVVIEAMQWDGESREVRRWVGSKATKLGSQLAIGTLEGRVTAQPGDYIIKGVKGEFYPIKADIFAETYEPADV